ncbi:MAG: NAD(P)-dependent oxidoreductase [Fibrobacter sp.]|nr:NAD(P)-dependent oxidoreductase [Fibrobacter sp.]
MRVFIFLEHTIDAFRFDNNHLNILQETYPDWEFTHVNSENELVLNLSECELLITWYFKPKWYDLSPNLLAIFTPAAGHDWIARKSGIPVFHGSFHGQIMAESLLSMILFFNRKLNSSIVNYNNHVWERNYLSSTHSLNFQQALIIGFGSIGRTCAKILKAFGCKVIGVKRSPYDPLTDKCADNIVAPENIDTVLSQADHVISFLPGNSSTDNFFTKSFFEKMKPSSYFYCLGRGNCYSENDLAWCLKNKVIAGAGLDVCHEYILMYVNELINHLKTFYDKNS